MAVITLTKRQHELMWMDTYAEYPEGMEGTTLENGTPWGGNDGVTLRNEIRKGRAVTVSPFLIKEVENRADMDSDPVEQRLYRRLLKKVRGAA